MKTTRLIAGSMFLITACLHVYSAFAGYPFLPFEGWLGAGILYLFIGIFILLKKRFAYWLGLIPIIALILVPFKLDFSTIDWTIIMLPIELIAVICCIILLAGKKKG